MFERRKRISFRMFYFSSKLEPVPVPETDLQTGSAALLLQQPNTLQNISLNTSISQHLRHYGGSSMPP